MLGQEPPTGQVVFFSIRNLVLWLHPIGWSSVRATDGDKVGSRAPRITTVMVTDLPLGPFGTLCAFVLGMALVLALRVPPSVLPRSRFQSRLCAELVTGNYNPHFVRCQEGNERKKPPCRTRLLCSSFVGFLPVFHSSPRVTTTTYSVLCRRPKSPIPNGSDTSDIYTVAVFTVSSVCS